MLRELRPMLALAIPVVTAEIGWIMMGIVDTIMVGPLGPAAIGAVGVGSTLFMTPAVFGIGLLLGLDTFVSQAFGAGRIQECHRWLFNGLALAVVYSIPLMLIVAGGLYLLPLFGFHGEVLTLITPYMGTVIWSALPLMVYAAFRRYLQAMNIVRPVMIALVVANLINAAANWILIYGRFGVPALGVVGAAWATVISRIGLAGFLFGVIVYRERERPSGLHDVPFALDPVRMWQIVRLGLPAAGQILLEVGVFAAASALAGRIAPAAVAAHHIVLNVVGLIFMIPYGLGTAAAVRVGQAIGRRDAHGARVAGWMALALGTGVMSLSAVLFALAPRPLVRVFSDDAGVIELGVGLFLVAAVFQLFDGVQTVTTGALRGLGITHTPMLANLVGHWGIGLPLAYVLCFQRGWGVQGLWAGLALGLMLIGSLLLFVWHRRSAAAGGMGSAIMARGGST